MKTGELFEISAFLGATLGGHGAEYGTACAKFGIKFGCAYQIFDDLLDFFGTEESAGETLGTDFACGDPKMGCLGGATALQDLPQTNHRPIVQNGVLERGCRELMQAYFRMKRAGVN